MTIAEWLKKSSSALAGAGIGSARLDAELILSHTVRKSRTFLHAHPEEVLSPRTVEIADARLQLRLDRTPLAYIIGHKEFYGRHFLVTTATLVPRPESETIITLLKESVRQPELPIATSAPKLVDVGTGSGCLGITAKLELPELDVTLVDTSRHALTVAESNATRLGAEVTALRSNLLQSYPYSADFILANLPYVADDWEVSPETGHEPKEALYADEGGLALIYRLLEESKSHMTPGGLLFIEADPRQHKAIIKRANDHGFGLRTSQDFILVFHIQ